MGKEKNYFILFLKLFGVIFGVNSCRVLNFHL